jgi:hypothetical protein
LIQIKKFKTYCQIAEYVGFLEVIEGFQVVRIAHVSKTMRMNHAARYYFSEVLQNFINPDGKVTTMSLNVNGLSYCYDQWCFCSEMTIKDDCNRYGGFYMRQNISPYLIHPNMKIRPEYERNGYRGQCCGIAPHILMKEVLQDAKAETLIKMNQLDLLNYYHHKSSGPIYHYWTSIKICFRNSYIIKDASMWFDYLELLEYFGKDVKNAHYVCPENLKDVHDKLMNKKREIDRRTALIKNQEKIERDQKAFLKQKARFFDLLFTHENITIKPLQSIEEFMKEGDILHHCVYTNGYYRKPESLIMSARINDKPIETIEVSLKTLDIVQSRGLMNQDSEHHDQIVQIVRKNIDAIAQKNKPVKRSKKVAA